MRAAIEWSVELLGGDERDVLRRTAVFTGGFSLNAAEKVLGADVAAIESLVEKNLMYSRNERLWTLETIREFAQERLEESGEAEALRQAHAEHFAAAARESGLRLRNAERAALGHLSDDYENARAAFDWSLAHDKLELCSHLVEGLWLFWLMRGMTADGYHRAQQVVARSSTPSGFLLNQAGELARFSGDTDQALELKQRAIPALESAGADSDLAAALSDLAEILIERGDLEKAERMADRAVAIGRGSVIPGRLPRARSVYSPRTRTRSSSTRRGAVRRTPRGLARTRVVARRCRRLHARRCGHIEKPETTIGRPSGFERAFGTPSKRRVTWTSHPASSKLLHSPRTRANATPRSSCTAPPARPATRPAISSKWTTPPPPRGRRGSRDPSQHADSGGRTWNVEEAVRLG